MDIASIIKEKAFVALKNTDNLKIIYYNEKDKVEIHFHRSISQSVSQ